MNEETQIKPIYRKVRGDRKARVFFMRKAIADYMEDMPARMQDAMIEISQAKYFYESPGNVKTMSYGRVPGKSPQDLNAYQIDIKNRYEKWSKELCRESILAHEVCIRVCQWDEGLEPIRKDKRISWRRARELLYFGLGEYCTLAGWK